MPNTPYYQPTNQYSGNYNSYPYGQVQQTYIPPVTPVSNYQQPQNQIRQTSILGHMISNPNEITPQEVPMDGSISLFPMQDGSAVYGKTWDSNGQIKTIKFIPENIDQQNSETDPFDAINDRLDSIEKLLRNRREKYNKPYNRKYQNTESVKDDKNES